MKKTLNELMQSLSTIHVDTLMSIYSFRCLDSNQIWQLHFQQTTTDESLSKKKRDACIRKLLNSDLIKSVYYNVEKEPVYFLTPQGIRVIRQSFQLPASIYDSQKKAVKRGYYRASELEIYPKNINHQIHLNQFIINFQQLNMDVKYKYYDEKYVSQYANIRPDGMISLIDTDIFLEMDMATESKKQLYDKWENYRSFLSSREYAYREKRIVVFFIIDGTNKTKERIDLVKYTIYERLLDQLDGDFEIYVGSREQLLSLMKNRIIPACNNQDPYIQKIKKVLEEKHDFHISDAEEVFEDTKHTYYLTKLNENKKIRIEQGRMQEFVVDDYFFEPTSVISKIAYMEKNNSLFKLRFKREISYLIIGHTEAQLYNDVKIADLIGLRNIFFSTYQRLQNKSFHDALFQFDHLGNIHHFVSNALDERHFELNLDQQHISP